MGRSITTMEKASTTILAQIIREREGKKDQGSNFMFIGKKATLRKSK